MKRLTIILCLMLIAGHLLTEVGSGLWLIFRPEIFYIDPFPDPNYVFPSPEGTPPGKIDLYWYLKYLSDDFLWCVTYFVMAQVAKMYSRRLFLIACVFFAFHFLDFLMNIWNFKSYHWLYIVLYTAIGVALIYLFRPDKKQAVIKSLK